MVVVLAQEVHRPRAPGYPASFIDKYLIGPCAVTMGIANADLKQGRKASPNCDNLPEIG
jgi:hypothetical protein